MSLLLAAAVAGAGAIIGSAVSAWSQQRTNESQERLQNATNEKSIELANTAHQREVADLKAAGLNPVLSAGSNGAITPTLGTAQVQNPIPNMGELAVQTANAMSTAKQVSAGSELAKAQAQQAKVQTELQPALAKAEIAEKMAGAGSAKAQQAYTETMKDVDKAKKEAETNKIDKETPYGGKTANTIKKWANTARSILPI